MGPVPEGRARRSCAVRGGALTGLPLMRVTSGGWHKSSGGKPTCDVTLSPDEWLSTNTMTLSASRSALRLEADQVMAQSLIQEADHHDAGLLSGMTSRGCSQTKELPDTDVIWVQWQKTISLRLKVDSLAHVQHCQVADTWSISLRAGVLYRATCAEQPQHAGIDMQHSLSQALTTTQFVGS